MVLTASLTLLPSFPLSLLTLAAPPFHPRNPGAGASLWLPN
jgi:hypothetical protein